MTYNLLTYLLVSIATLTVTIITATNGIRNGKETNMTENINTNHLLHHTQVLNKIQTKLDLPPIVQDLLNITIYQLIHRLELVKKICREIQ